MRLAAVVSFVIAVAGPQLARGQSDGSPAPVPSSSPPPVPNLTPAGTLTGAVQIAAAGQRTCAVLRDHSVRCWGAQPLPASADGASVPVAVSVPGVAGVADVAVGDQHACARLLRGTVTCWGNNQYGGLADADLSMRAPVAVDGLSQIVQVVAHGFDTCARTRDGRIACWGMNETGGLGLGSASHDPVRTPTWLDGVTGAQGVQLGGGHGCFRSAAGVSCWGHNRSGEVGDGTEQMRTAPVAVIDLPQPVTEISAGGVLEAAHTCARLADGTAVCWGSNAHGALGDGTTTHRTHPVPVHGLTAVAQIVAAGAHTCARLQNGTVSCWGENDHGQLGDGTTTHRLVPTPVPGLTGVVQIALGSTHSCARLRDGSVRCWGDNGRGALGDGSSYDRSSPVLVLRTP